MISFYKPTPKVTGTAMSFYLNKRDNSFFSNLIKQDSWDSSRKIGSFQKNKKVEGKNVNIKFSQTEIASIIDSVDRNTEISGYHGSNQVVRFSFGPYTPKTKTEEGEWIEGTEQKGFSFRVTRESKEDSTNKQSYVIGLTFAEGKLLREHLVYLLNESFALTDKAMEASFRKNQERQQQQQQEVVNEVTEIEDEDDLW
jgi:hypothetical protein